MRAAVTALWIERGINLITVSMPENTVVRFLQLCIPTWKTKTDDNVMRSYCYLHQFYALYSDYVKLHCPF